jgi:uncharacterized protein (DUF952 family)
MLIYKICTEAMWENFQRTRMFAGMPIDQQDGYIHLSTAEQQEGTARKYFAGKSGHMVLTIDADALGEALVWEASSSRERPGLFPHLYGPLPFDAVRAAVPLIAPES